MGDKSGVVLAEIVVILILLALTSSRGKALWAVLLGKATVSAPAIPSAPAAGIETNPNVPPWYKYVQGHMPVVIMH
jgi:hypothetical protein